MQPPDAAEFAERLNQVLDGVKGCPQRDKRGAWLGALYGVSKASGGDWLRGKNLPEPWRVLHMADRWKVSFMWLYFGRGQMNGSATSTTNEEVLSVSPPVRLDLLTIAVEVVGVELAAERPTPAQQSRYIALCYDLLDQGVSHADVVLFVRRAASLITGEPNGPKGTDSRA